MALSIGKRAPDFSLINQDGKKASLSNFNGKWLVLYFYPKDNTPGCTIEGVEFSSVLKDFEKMNAAVVGISRDSVESHCNFISKQKLKVTLLSDPEKTAIDAYGVWQKKKFMGREFMGIVRSTFLINPKGEVAFIWPKVQAKGHAAEVKEKLAELSKN